MNLCLSTGSIASQPHSFDPLVRIVYSFTINHLHFCFALFCGCSYTYVVILLFLWGEGIYFHLCLWVRRKLLLHFWYPTLLLLSLPWRTNLLSRLSEQDLDWDSFTRGRVHWIKGPCSGVVPAPALSCTSCLQELDKLDTVCLSWPGHRNPPSSTYSWMDLIAAVIHDHAAIWRGHRIQGRGHWK